MNEPASRCRFLKLAGSFVVEIGGAILPKSLRANTIRTFTGCTYNSKWLDGLKQLAAAFPTSIQVLMHGKPERGGSIASETYTGLESLRTGGYWTPLDVRQRVARYCANCLRDKGVLPDEQSANRQANAWMARDCDVRTIVSEREQMIWEHSSGSTAFSGTACCGWKYTSYIRDTARGSEIYECLGCHKLMEKEGVKNG